MNEQYSDVATQPALPGMEPAAQHKVMIVNEHGVQDTFADMKALKEAELTPGKYEVWRFGGNFTVEVVPARARTRFESAVKRPHSGPKKPRKARKAKGTTEANGGAA